MPGTLYPLYVCDWYFIKKCAPDPVLAYLSFSLSHLADVLHVLQLPELAQRVVPERLVERRVAVLVGHVEVAALAHEQAHDLRVLPLDGQVQRRLQVHVLQVHVGAPKVHQQLGNLARTREIERWRRQMCAESFTKRHHAGFF